MVKIRAKDQRAKKLGVPPRTLWSNDQDPVLLVLNLKICVLSQLIQREACFFESVIRAKKIEEDEDFCSVDKVTDRS